MKFEFSKVMQSHAEYSTVIGVNRFLLINNANRSETLKTLFLQVACVCITLKHAAHTYTIKLQPLRSHTKQYLNFYLMLVYCAALD